jgi:hypothetical protein
LHFATLAGLELGHSGAWQGGTARACSEGIMNTVRKSPNPNLSQARYMREMDKICEAPMSEFEAARYEELRARARSSTGIGGPDRKDYALLSCVAAAQKAKR